MVLPVGKLPPELLESLLRTSARGADEIVLGPGLGEDACALRLPAGVLVCAMDPITLTGSGIGAHAVWINANDVAVTGVRPRWFLATVLAPEGTDESELRLLFDSMTQALDDLGARLVGGHTEVTAAVRQPVVVGQMLGLAEDGAFVRTGGAQSGDTLVQVGPAPVEGAAVLAQELAHRLGDVDGALVEAARSAIREPGISVVEPALLAKKLGATSLHDPTEGGLASGILEVALASGARLVVEPEKVLWFEPGLAVCRALGADPWGTLASGALLATFPGEEALRAVAELADAGYPAATIGHVLPGREVELRPGQPLPRFERDEVARLLEGPASDGPETEGNL